MPHTSCNKVWEQKQKIHSSTKSNKKTQIHRLPSTFFSTAVIMITFIIFQYKNTTRLAKTFLVVIKFIIMMRHYLPPNTKVIFFHPWLDSPSGPRPPHCLGFEITPQSVGLLWTSDRPVAGTSIWQHTTLIEDIHAPGGIRTRNPSESAAADAHLRSRGHWDRLYRVIVMSKTHSDY